jgi:hypothetical protein
MGGRMSEWIDDLCPKCGKASSTPIWDDGECQGCGLPFTFDPERGLHLDCKPSRYYWGVSGWKYYEFDARPEPDWVNSHKKPKLSEDDLGIIETTLFVYLDSGRTTIGSGDIERVIDVVQAMKEELDELGD